jgi:hypothetical protein
MDWAKNTAEKAQPLAACSAAVTAHKLESTQPQKYKVLPKQAGYEDDISFSDQWSSELRDLAT